VTWAVRFYDHKTGAADQHGIPDESRHADMKKGVCSQTAYPLQNSAGACAGHRH